MGKEEITTEKDSKEGVDFMQIIQKYYEIDSKSYEFLVEHSEAVTRKAIEIAKKVSHLNPDLKFIEEASMLHDIGIYLTENKEIGCFGTKPYICHGYLGREILEKEGLPKHALVCERHVGVGLPIEEIQEEGLPLPERDMLPVTIEEQIICFADKFFSKNEEFLSNAKSLDMVREEISKHGNHKTKRFDEWVKMFGYNT